MGLEKLTEFLGREAEVKKPMIIFDLANNHNGDVNHGLKVINGVYEACKEFTVNFNFSFKFQYRDLDTFIHQDFKDRKDIKYVKRFLETRLNEGGFMLMKNEADKLGFISACTPFDEKSVDMIEKQNFDIIKIASCSFTDWPLLERVVKTDKPIIASTAGNSLDDIDRVVTFLLNRDKRFCLMHCVAEYPTDNKNLQLNQINLLKDRYKGIPIGYSTHESPDNVDSIKIAIGKGALIFERHVAVGENRNAYSSSPEQIKKWLESAKQSLEMIGISGERVPITEKESKDLRGLRRAVFARTDIKNGDRLDPDKIYYAIPGEDGQMLANDMSKYVYHYAKEDIEKNKPILFDNLKIIDAREKIKKIVHNDIEGILMKADLPISRHIDLELSHHYGIDQFHEFGCSIINIINRDYCKKFIVLLPGQKNPTHLHKQKEESFIIAYGDISLNIGGVEKEYIRGDVVTVNRGERHSFSSKNGGIFEEISTTHYQNDSFYEDERIMRNSDRKTYVKLWLDNE